MKKIVLGGIFIQIFILSILVSYAAMTKEPISESNLSDLKGKWEGWRTIGVRNLRTELEIDNDTLPLTGKFIFHEMQKRGIRGETDTVEFKKGMIKDNNFYLKYKQDYFELSLYKDNGKMKLEGNFHSMGISGTITLNKK